jgi:hypothetical protein
MRPGPRLALGLQCPNSKLVVPLAAKVTEKPWSSDTLQVSTHGLAKLVVAQSLGCNVQRASGWRCSSRINARLY